MVLRAITGENKKPHTKSVAANPFVERRFRNQTSLRHGVEELFDTGKLANDEERALRMEHGVTITGESKPGKKELPAPTANEGDARAFARTMLARIEAAALARLEEKDKRPEQKE